MSQSTLQTLRLALVDALGARCSVCGYAKDKRVLEVVRDDISRAEYQKINRYKDYLKMIADAANGQYRLMCRNCKGIYMYDRQNEARQTKRQATKDVEASPRLVVVWQTSLSPADAAQMPYEAVEGYIRHGDEVVVVPTDGKVYVYGTTTPVAETWADYAAKNSLPTTLADRTIQHFTKEPA